MRKASFAANQLGTSKFLPPRTMMGRPRHAGRPIPIQYFSKLLVLEEPPGLPVKIALDNVAETTPYRTVLAARGILEATAN